MRAGDDRIGGMPRAADWSAEPTVATQAHQPPTGFGWRRGVCVLTLVGLAFAAALATGRMAEGLEQLALAGLSLALLLGAVAVALPPVVRSWQRNWRRRGEGGWGTQVRVTAAGLPFLAALLILVAAAVNSGNNLIYLVVAALLGALVTSGIFSTANLGGITLDLEWPEHAFARRPAPVRLRLGNQKRLLPSYSLRLTARSIAVDGTAGNGKRGRQTGMMAAGMQAAYFPYVPARRHAVATSEITFPRRGRYSTAAFSLSTRFPFGLIEKRRRFRPLADEGPGSSLVVYPAIEAASEPFAAWAAEGPRQATPQPGAGEELYRLRPHTAGDSLRLVHWKASAKMGELRVRELSRDQDRRLRVLVALAPGGASGEQMERAIELCASLIWAVAAAGDWIEFVGANAAPEFGEGEAGGLPAGTAWMPPPMPGADALHPILRYLALLDLAGPLAPLPPSWQAGPGERWFLGNRGQTAALPRGAVACIAAAL